MAFSERWRWWWWLWRRWFFLLPLRESIERSGARVTAPRLPLQRRRISSGSLWTAACISRAGGLRTSRNEHERLRFFFFFFSWRRLFSGTARTCGRCKGASSSRRSRARSSSCWLQVCIEVCHRWSGEVVEVCSCVSAKGAIATVVATSGWLAHDHGRWCATLSAGKMGDSDGAAEGTEARHVRNNTREAGA